MSGQKKSSLIDLNLLQPSFDSWMEGCDRSSRLEEFLSSPKLLVMSGCLEMVIKYWIKYEIAQEYISLNPTWLDKEGKRYIENQLSNETKMKKKRYMPQEWLEDKLLVAPATMKWSEDQWNYLTEKIFLGSDNAFDVITCDYLFSRSSSLMTELYYRLVDDGCAMQTLANLFSSVAYNSVSERELQDLPPVVFKAVSKIKTKEAKLSKPVKMGEKYFIFNLKKYLPAELNEKLRARILALQLEQWVEMGAAKIKGSLQLKDLG